MVELILLIDMTFYYASVVGKEQSWRALIESGTRGLGLPFFSLHNFDNLRAVTCAVQLR